MISFKMFSALILCIVDEETLLSLVGRAVLGWGWGWGGGGGGGGGGGQQRVIKS